MRYFQWPEKTIIITALGMLAFGIAELTIGSQVYGFTANVKIGAWYVGIFAVITAICGFSVRLKAGFVGAYPVMCIVTSVVAFIGTLVDGIAYGVIGYIKACGNNGVDYWGDSDFYADVAYECLLPQTNRDCYCVISGNSPCFRYDGNGPGTFDEDNCDPVLNEYKRLVLDSWSICLALFFYCWVVFFVGVCACCGRASEGPESKDPAPASQPNPMTNPTVMYPGAPSGPAPVVVTAPPGGAYVVTAAPPTAQVISTAPPVVQDVGGAPAPGVVLTVEHPTSPSAPPAPPG